MPQEKLTITIPEYAQLIGVSENLAYREARAGRLGVKVLTVGRRMLLVRSEVEKLLGKREG